MPKRQPILAVLIALLVVTAGCSTSQVDKPDQDGEVILFNEETATASSTPTATPREQVNVTLRNASPRKLHEINQTIQAYYLDLASNQSARQIAARSAHQTCTKFSPVNQSLFTDPSNVQSRTRMLSHMADVVNAHSEKQYVSPRQLRSIADKAGVVAKYTTMIGPWNQYHEASCNFNRSQPETVEDYYIATGALLVELSLMQYQVYYKASFKTVQSASHTPAFRLIQSKFGNQVFGLAESISHWTARNGFESAPKVLREKAESGNLSLATFNFTQANTTLNSSLSEAGNVNSNLTRMASDCYEHASKSEEDSGGGWIDKGKDIVGDAKDYAKDTALKGNISLIVDDIEGVDAENISKDTMNSIRNCMTEKQNNSG